MNVSDEVVSNVLEAIHSSDLEALRDVLESCPEAINFEAVFVVDWLNYASQFSDRHILEYLVEKGLSVNKADPESGERAINHAASNGNVENVSFLLSIGAELDDSTVITNPLFSAVLGRSKEIAAMMLERGANSKKTYSTNRKLEIDALAFAVERGEMEIANMIAIHNSQGNQERANALLQAADKIADQNTS